MLRESGELARQPVSTLKLTWVMAGNLTLRRRSQNTVRQNAHTLRASASTLKLRVLVRVGCHEFLYRPNSEVVNVRICSVPWVPVSTLKLVRWRGADCSSARLPLNKAHTRTERSFNVETGCQRARAAQTSMQDSKHD